METPESAPEGASSTPPEGQAAAPAAGTAATEAQSAAAPAAGSATPSQGTPAPEGAGAPSGTSLDTDERFPREYVEKLRDEAAKYRTNLREIEQHFEGWDEQDRTKFLTIAKDLLSDDPAAAAAAAKQLREVSDRVAAELGEAERPLTRAEVEKLYEEREKQRQSEDAQARLLREADELGYKPGTLEFSDLLWIAGNDPEAKSQLSEAHRILTERQKAREQEIIDQYLAEKQGQAQAYPNSPAGGGAPGTTNEPPKTWEEARARARARFAAQVGQ